MKRNENSKLSNDKYKKLMPVITIKLKLSSSIDEVEFEMLLFAYLFFQFIQSQIKINFLMLQLYNKKITNTPVSYTTQWGKIWLFYELLQLNVHD